MSDAVTVLRQKAAKLESRVNKTRASLEAAEIELAEIQTAIRVLAKMGLAPEVEPDGDHGGGGEVNAAHTAILALVPHGEEFAIAPKEVFTQLKGRDDFDQSADYVRTALWRMATKKKILESRNGLYWRPVRPESVEAPDAQTPRASNGSVGPHGGGTGFPSSSPEGSIPSGSTQFQVPSFDDDLDDVPF